jgi:hypothetical protein
MVKSLIRTALLTVVFLTSLAIYGYVRGHRVAGWPLGLAAAAVGCAAIGVWAYQRIRKCNWNWGTELTAIVVFGVAAIWILSGIMRGIARGP